MADPAKLEARIEELELQVADLYSRLLGEVPIPGAALEDAPEKAGSDGCGTVFANHFNVEAAANGECEWCADIAKAHAAGRAEIASWLCDFVEGNKWLEAEDFREELLAGLPEADRG